MTQTPHLPPGLKAVFFDLDGTIRENSPSAVELIRITAESHGIMLDADDIRGMVRGGHAFWGDQERVKTLRYSIDDDRIFWKEFFYTYISESRLPETLKQKISIECGSQFFDTLYFTDGLMDDARDTLLVLRQKGYIIGLVSNRSRTLDEAILRLGILELFDFTLSAGQVNSWKPDSLIYQMALQESGGIAPHEAVFVGDNYYTDILGAQQAGLHAILLDVHDAFHDKPCLRITRLAELITLL